MAFSQSKLDAIEEAISNGSLEIEYSTSGGVKRRVQYRSLDEMLKIRDLMRAELGVTPGRTKRIKAEFQREC